MVNEIQRFDIVGSPGSGKFTLTFEGQTTTAIAYHPPAGDVQRALEALTSIGAGNVVVTKDGNWGYVCNFLDALGNQDLPELTADDTQLGGGATIQVITVTQGAPDTLPPDTGTTLQTPCTLSDLLRFAATIFPVTSGAHHNTTVTTTNTAITVSWQ